MARPSSPFPDFSCPNLAKKGNQLISMQLMIYSSLLSATALSKDTVENEENRQNSVAKPRRQVTENTHSKKTAHLMAWFTIQIANTFSNSPGMCGIQVFIIGYWQNSIHNVCRGWAKRFKHHLEASAGISAFFIGGHAGVIFYNSFPHSCLLLC